jgi:hypothetical protein
MKGVPGKHSEAKKMKEYYNKSRKKTQSSYNMLNLGKISKKIKNSRNN